MKTKIGIILLMSALAFGALGKERSISGKVTQVEDGSAIPGVNVVLKGTNRATTTDRQGIYVLNVPSTGGTLVFSMIGLKTLEVSLAASNIVNVAMHHDVTQLSEVVLTRPTPRQKKDGGKAAESSYDMAKSYGIAYEAEPQWNTEEYDGINENIFHGALRNPLSTFSIDVDAASYSNIRRFIHNGQRPPEDAVRIEEMVNYFDYNYEQPKGDDPFHIYTEVGAAPWNPKHKLVHIGLQGKNIPTENLPATNLVFLLDVSGSMNQPNKLPLLKASFKLLVDQLRPQDRVAIVVYAGAAGLVLPSTSGANKQTIKDALEKLEAGGSTAGGAGIKLAYHVALENFVREGNNRVIIATDGDFNVGESSNAAMERLIEEKRQDGVFLTVLGFGMGNYKDSKMEILADKGNGNYAYIDNVLEAQKVLVNEFGGTLFTIAKDVKLQIEFNPARVQAYRLIGYENRVLRNEDFNNDKKDAGDLGSGHTVTALYEIIPVGVESEFYQIDDLKYQTTKIDPAAIKTSELLTVKFRYKKPDGDVSKLIVATVKDSNRETSSEDFRWSAAVAAFGMILRDSEYANGFTTENVLTLAQGARGTDKEGYRQEFLNLVKTMSIVAQK